MRHRTLKSGKVVDERNSEAVQYIEGKLGHVFSDKYLLLRALTHPSLGLTRCETYEQLEFLGDKMLNLAIASALFNEFPKDSDGELSIKLNRLVSGEVVTMIARDLEIGKFIKMSAAESSDFGKIKARNLENCMEALLGALFRDGGFEVASKTIRELWADKIKFAHSVEKDAKTQLQEWLQSRKLPLPEYLLISRSGPGHASVFSMKLFARGLPQFEASGNSKKEAQLRIAEKAMEYVTSLGDSKIKVQDLN